MERNLDLDDINIGIRLSKLRFSLGFSQIEFSKDLGCDQRKISRMERGEQQINGKTLLQLKEQYGLNGDWLLSGAGEMFVNNSGSLQRKEIPLRDVISQIDQDLKEVQQTGDHLTVIKMLNEKIEDQKKIIDAQKVALDIATKALEQIAK